MVSNMSLVHLDLKGAPPKLSYLEEVIPLFAKWGATGLLIEYEDMFPYNEELSDVPCPQAYSEGDVQTILTMAQHNNLEIMPLVQTFGHMEFVLKHEMFAKCREVPKYPAALCPSHPDSFKLVTTMVEQILRLHPQTKWLHIGCDEVYFLGKCDKCLECISNEDTSPLQLFFNHVRRIAEYVKSRYPLITLIIWDDMFRFATVAQLVSSGLKGLVEPMVWHYSPTLQLPDNLFENLATHFPHIWVASAFKGATGVNTQMTNISFHLENHMSWLRLLQQKKHLFESVRGFAVTGWQRYDHYAVLCELLPVALPSLAVCLSVVTNHIFSNSTHQDISRQLGFKHDIPMDPYRSHIPEHCQFPGSDVYMSVFEWIHLQAKCDNFQHGSTFQAWMNDFNLERRFVNPMHVEPLVSEAAAILERLIELKLRIHQTMLKVFTNDTVHEWIQVSIEPKISTFTNIVQKGQIALKH